MLDRQVAGEGLFHRYQLTNQAVEYRGEFHKLALDRETGQLFLWMEAGGGE